jgi:hypothetical protein
MNRRDPEAWTWKDGAVFFGALLATPPALFMWGFWLVVLGPKGRQP